MTDKRSNYLKKRQERDPELHTKYKATMEEYIAKGHAKRIQVKESDKSDESLSKKSIWYLPHHPVTHPRKPEKVRIVFDCATKFRDAYLNDQRLQ